MDEKILGGYPIKAFNGITVNTMLPCDDGNYHSYPCRTVKYIVIHYTGNKSDTAKSNAIYFNNGKREASAHYFVDDKECYQSVELNNAVLAIGDTSKYKHYECRDENSISIAMCCFKDYMISKRTELNTAYLCASLCLQMGITDDMVDTYVLRHWDVWPRDCPSGWTGDNNSRWLKFKHKVKKILNKYEKTIG